MRQDCTISPARISTRRGFTLIELLVVVAVIVILIAILVPSMYHVRLSAMKAATTSELHSLRTGLQQYYSNFNIYPASSGSFSNAGGFPTAQNGPEMLAEALTGYLPAAADGAGPPADGAFGFRTTKLGNAATGAIHGPYVSVTPANYSANTATDQFFIDPWATATYPGKILYYRSTRSLAGVPLNTATTIFDVATSTTCLFYYTDCSTTQPSDPAFLGMLSASGNNTVSGGVTGSTNYLLISAGPPEYRAPSSAYFNSNNIVMSGDQ